MRSRLREKLIRLVVSIALEHPKDVVPVVHGVIAQSKTWKIDVILVVTGKHIQSSLI
ncbi:hypothetical protein OROMI_006254 [Orobanche minor]